eukprot:TRINITY_DN1148_c0_g1_i6.p1 TRINITY_DN1148_c0_g1~~TRINITY_DN1148_c0_g1_i6.p1  ORF type:complete len:144 (-),score=1.09 TRINITY_DN1148_c0_g1_i6:206-637(-)
MMLRRLAWLHRPATAIWIYISAAVGWLQWRIDDSMAGHEFTTARLDHGTREAQRQSLRGARDALRRLKEKTEKRKKMSTMSFLMSIRSGNILARHSSTRWLTAVVISDHPTAASTGWTLVIGFDRYSTVTGGTTSTGTHGGIG